ncbi:mechanosensitive ion channel family protein [Methanosphaera sp. ISO3-F5]|uniref:mechanosensitive ion channel family protein n=1 Tax=Methanosphaera sp. ISO3-F5 TaxID=1452353 RepID=UPI002B25E015|nr:mechanosensitive ion channel family protein [Methanosphaera sp. ISO3-F5]WQH64204.1 mechanosensitive ion channel family protein [Methanosphaera sp. ISO3-F5]
MILDQYPELYSGILLVIKVALAIIIPIIIFTIINKTIQKYKSYNSVSKGSLEILSKILRYLTFLIIILGILDVLGIDIHSLLVSVGIVSLAVTLAAKDTLSNVISGAIIILEKRFVVGDMIEIDGHKGIVQKIGFKSVELLYKKKYMVVPNVLFTTKPFINHTRNGYYAIYFNVTILNRYNFDEKISQLEKILDDTPSILKEPKYLIMIKNITTSGVDVKVKAYIEDPNMDTKTVSEIIKRIKREMVLDDMY